MMTDGHGHVWRLGGTHTGALAMMTPKTTELVFELRVRGYVLVQRTA
jgi:hypothetical protein